MPNPSLQGPSLPPRSGNAKQLVVILHGWGADGHNLIDIGEYLARDLPDAHFIAPNAHEVCEVNPYGFQWFSLTDRTPAVMLEGTRKAAKVLNAFLDEELARLKLDNSQLALVGFSQGTMLSLHTALRRSPQIACVAGFSGALIDGGTMLPEVAARPPVCLIHGEMDEVVPFIAMDAAAAGLRAAGVEVETHARPYLGHSIDMEGLQIAARFLKGKLG